MKKFYVYMMASKKDGVLYIGVTSDLVRRVWEHKNEIVKGFTEKYKVKKLVYYEVLSDAESAFKRETQMKAWKRNWKIELIEKEDREWKDLYDEIV